MREESTVYYGKEPFDLRLTVLRLIRCLPAVIGITLLGTLLFGGGYYMKNVVLNEDTIYTVTSTYRVSFVDEPSKAGDYYINEMTWNTYVNSKEFLDTVWGHMHEDTDGFILEYDKAAEKLSDTVEARLASDIHVPSTVVTAKSAKWAEIVAQAVEETMVEEFVESNEQVAAIEVIDPALEAQEVVPDVRTDRAFILSGILSFFFAMVFFLLRESGDSAVWLPATLRIRYGLPVLGTVNSPELNQNLNYLFKGQTRIPVYVVNDDDNPSIVIAKIKEMLVYSIGTKEDGREWLSLTVPMISEKTYDKMRNADGILLAVKAGRKIGKRLEYDLEYFKTQEISVRGVLLWDADEWLIRKYYGLW